jgi:large repetitive protein
MLRRSRAVRVYGPGSIEIITNDQGYNAESTPQIADDTVAITVNRNGPINVVPDTQTTQEGNNLVFSWATGNAVQIVDPEAGANTVQVELIASAGTLTLNGTTGLSFSFSDGNGTGSGTGTGDSTMEFRGAAADINAALDGMFLTPGSYGGYTVEIITNDLGYNDTASAVSADHTFDVTVSDGPWAAVPSMQTVDGAATMLPSRASIGAVNEGLICTMAA